MTFHFDFLYLIGAALFFYTGYHQFYLRRNVDQLERLRKLTTEAAARVRKKPMRLIGWTCLIAGAGFAFLGFVRL